MKLLNILRNPRYSKRLREVVGVFRKYNLDEWFVHIPLQSFRDMLKSKEAKSMRDMPLAVRFRLALSELGTTYIKLGQVLSTRSDIVGIEIAEELRKLQSDTPADSSETILELITDELGQPPELLFAAFDPIAFSSASIGQVHHAKLDDGRNVVVKIQHSNIQEKVNVDLELLQVLASAFQEYVAASRPYQPVLIAREFRRTLLHELDFTTERRNLEQFSKNFENDETVRIPETYSSLCSKRVLTMELLEGIPGSKSDQIQASGVSLDVFARDAANVFLNMIFRDGFYHADPHPGNYILMESGVFGLIDCGMVGRLDETSKDLFSQLLLMLIDGDGDGLADLLLRAGSAPEDVDRVTFRSDVNNLIIEHGSRSLDEFNLSEALEEFTSIVRRYQVLMPSSASLLIKTLIMLEGTSQELNPSFSLAEILQPFKEQLINQRISPKRWFKQISYTVRDIDRLIRQGPRNIADILERLQSGKLKIRHEVEGIDVVANKLVSGVLIASLFMGSSLLLSLKVAPLIGNTSLMGMIGSVTAIILGAKLLWKTR
ncbi:MAG: AarF/ABC1/UbiB kinase family protein [Lentisphaeria bacterium]|nr:AarF/ABC1/UbiB kinase family protein [Lentisphaeria bacterium]